MMPWLLVIVLLLVVCGVVGVLAVRVRRLERQIHPLMQTVARRAVVKQWLMEKDPSGKPGRELLRQRLLNRAEPFGRVPTPPVGTT